MLEVILTPTQLNVYECIKNSEHTYTTPTDIMRKLGLQKQYVNNVLALLAERGLIKKIDRGRYQVGDN